MEKIIEQLYSQLQKQGFRAQLVPIHHLRDLEHAIKGRHDEGLLDDEFFRERLEVFSFDPPDDLSSATSLLVIAIPRPQTRATFKTNGKTLPLIIPPTYSNYYVIRQQVEDLLNEWLLPEGYRAASANVPLKTLAAHSGLVQYGRNNICYVEGMGSFLELTAYYTDLPCEADPWSEPHLMERCENCDACRKKCPTQAISSDRFIIRAERCIVFHNERPPEYPFPGWIDPARHNSLVGCMDCQKYCPENKRFLKWIDADEEFSQEETCLLLKGIPADQLPPEMVDKLQRLDMLRCLEVLPRNVGIFFNTDETIR